MKKGLLVVGTEDGLNIGDYIQAVAAEQFFDHIDLYLEREKLDEYDGEPVKIIMNGWYMHHPNHWPPAVNINPLFVAFHINSVAKQKLLSPKSINYLKKYSPIGCRDLGTTELLLSKGVDVYYSACLTLTLGYKYKSDKKNGKCYMVDPFYILHKGDFKTILRNIVELPFYYGAVKKIQRKLGVKKSVKELLALVSYYREYKKIFSKDLLLNAEYITHESSNLHKLYPTNGAKLDCAKALVKKYAEASLVITSRIHCALPCLGLETPVIYIENQQQEETSSCRLKGLKDFFNIIVWNNGHLKSLFPIKEIITSKSIISNKDDYRKYAKDLIKRCCEFTKDEN